MKARHIRTRIGCSAGWLARLPLTALAFALVPGVAQAAGTPCERMAAISSPTLHIESAAPVIGSLPEGAEVKGRGSHAGKISPYLVNLPQFCRVNAILNPVKGSRIEIELWLPKDWNGKLVGLGSHGFGGNFERGDMGMALRRGYAVVTSDLGHSSRAPVEDRLDQAVVNADASARGGCEQSANGCIRVQITLPSLRAQGSQR